MDHKQYLQFQGAPDEALLRVSVKIERDHIQRQGVSPSDILETPARTFRTFGPLPQFSSPPALG